MLFLSNTFYSTGIIGSSYSSGESSPKGADDLSEGVSDDSFELFWEVSSLETSIVDASGGVMIGISGDRLTCDAVSGAEDGSEGFTSV